MRPRLDNGELPAPPPGLDELTAAAEAKRLETWKQDKDAKRDDKYVRYIVKGLALSVTHARLRREAQALTGVPTLTLAWLCSRLRGFPVWLRADWTPYVYRRFIPKWYAGITTTEVYKAYQAARAEAPDDWGGGFGALFQIANVPNMYGTMVMHDTVVPLGEGKSVMLRRVHDTYLTVERLGDMLERLAGGVTFD